MSDEDHSDIPVEETPGYVGHIFDEFMIFSDGLLPLKGFDFHLYGQMADELDALQRDKEVDFGAGPVKIRFDAYSIQEIVTSIPCVDAIYDCPPDQGPAGGAGHIFLLDEGALLAQATACAEVLRAALDKDFKSLEVQYGQH